MTSPPDRNGDGAAYAWLRRAFRFGVPAVIVYLIVTRIDFNVLKTSFLGTRSPLFVLGLMHAPVLILLAAYRWKILLERYLKKAVPASFAFSRYWVGQALGFFTPASLGLDAYRIVAGGRRFGSYPRNVLIVLVEKLMALLTCMTLIVALYPLVPGSMDPRVREIVLVAYVLLLVSLAAVAFAVVAGRNRVVGLVVERAVRYVSSVLKIIAAKMGMDQTIGGGVRLSLDMITGPLKSHRVLAIIALSFGIQLVSSVKSQVYFLSLGYDIPFVVNLFVTPMIYFIFLLPISLGSIGIREGVYIIMYRMFGVPAEIALLISFYNLLGILLNNAAGGVIILFSRSGPDVGKGGGNGQEPDGSMDLG